MGDHTWSHPYLPDIPVSQQVSEVSRSSRASSAITDRRDALGADKQKILDISKAGTKPGAIILLHENRGQTYWAVNRLLPWLKKKGYTAVTVPELLALNPPDLNEVRRQAGAGVGFR